MGYRLRNVPIVVLLLFAGCRGCEGGKGALTIVNGTSSDIVFRLDNEEVEIASGNLVMNEDLMAGDHNLEINGRSSERIKIVPGMTTVYDVGGDGCYVVADFTEQYKREGSGTVKIIERFDRKTLFTTKEPLVANLGEDLPETLKEGEGGYRIHKVPCKDLYNDRVLIESLASVP